MITIGRYCIGVLLVSLFEMHRYLLGTNYALMGLPVTSTDKYY